MQILIFLILLLLYISKCVDIKGLKIEIVNENLDFDTSERETKMKEMFYNGLQLSVEYLEKTIQIDHFPLPTQSNEGCQYQPNGLSGNVQPKITTDIILFITNIDQIEDYEGSSLKIETCKFNASNQRPIVGNLLVSKNMYISQVYNSWSSKNKKQFQLIFDNLLHELIHFLGFQIQYTNKFQGYLGTQEIFESHSSNVLRGIQTAMFKTPKLKEKAKGYFDCSGFEGGQLENLDNTDQSRQQHWESTIFQQELMTLSNFKMDKKLSILTLALLEDTGWYHSIDYTQAFDMQYGKDKGCGFVQFGCFDTQNEFIEFKDEGQQCSFDYKGISTKNLFTQFNDRCPEYTIQTDCTDQNVLVTNVILQDQFSSYQQNSRCIKTSIVDKIQNQRSNVYSCLETVCINNTAVIKLKNLEFKCVYNNQSFEFDSNDPNSPFKGTIQCPDDLSLFCKQELNCDSFCTNQGYCKNGKCICLQGWAGKDCSIPCGQGLVLPYGLLTCVGTCGVGQFAINQTCYQCNEGCTSCTGEKYNQCTGCESGRFKLQDGQCLKLSCNLADCAECYVKNGQNQCVECENTKPFLFEGKCVNSCQDGFYEVVSQTPNICEQCPLDFNCQTCGIIAGNIECLNCIPMLENPYVKYLGKCYQNCPYYTYKTQNTCVQCHSECESCFGQNNNQCNSCNPGKYLFEGKCISECPVNYKDTYGNRICQEDFCPVARKNGTCVLKCDLNEYIRRTDKTCIPCSPECAQCVDYPDKCIKCPSDNLYLVNFFCSQNIPSSSTQELFYEQNGSYLQFSLKQLLILALIIFIFLK